MLVKSSVNRTLPSLKESVEISREKTKRLLDPHRMVDQEALKDTVARIGRPILHTELVRKIQQLTDNRVWVEESLVIKYLYGEIVFRFHTKDSKNKATGKRACAVAFKAGYLPEYSIVETDDRDIANNVIRGWRDVLVHLIKERLITKKQVLKAFGAPTPTNLDRFDRFTYQFNS